MAARRALNAIIVLGSFSALAWLLVTQHHELATSIAGIGHAKLRVVIFAVLCERVSMFAFARLQVRLLRAGGHELPLLQAIGIVFAGNALSVSVPIAGPGLAAAYSYRELERRHITRHTAGFALAVSGVLSTMTLGVIIAAGALASGNPVAAVFGLLGALVLGTVIGAVLIGMRIPASRRVLERAAARGVGLGQRVLRKHGDPPETVVASVLGQLASLRLSRRNWVAVVILSFINWLGDASCLYLSIRATGFNIPLRDLLLVWSAGLAAAGIGITPGGVGVVEVALVASLTGVGMSSAHAAVAVMIYRLISLWLVVLVGWVIYIVYRTRRIKRGA